jgi:hypothetical protein
MQDLLTNAGFAEVKQRPMTSCIRAYYRGVKK